ncbi:rhomboid family intramembrane serine protease [Candidatus Woesearchaeota archaeon]|nr:rhomboid family intramembrane serine protease [Candidatus Woesearchaeota archaeon]
MDNKNHWSSLWLSLAIFIIFIFQALMVNLTDIFILDTNAVLTRPWTLLTAIFIHSGLVHLLYNLFGLALFGIILENIIGTRKFLKLFFIAGLVASFASLPFYSRVLGASGAIFGIMGMLAILRPKMVIWLYGMPMPMFIALIVWALIDIFGIFFPQNTANISHLAGLAVGIIFGIINYKQYRENRPKKENISIDEKKVKEWENRF